MTQTDKGWIKLHRSMLEWEWIDDINTFGVFVFLIIKANHKENTWKGVNIPLGAVVTSQDKIAEKLGLSRQKVRTALSKLQSSNELKIKTTNKYSIITICKYKTYQLIENTSQPTSQPTSNQQVTTNKNIRTKEIKNIVEYLNSTANSNFKSTTTNTQKHIIARLNEDYTFKDFRAVIDFKTKEWSGGEMAQYLRPETLFGTKFESYLQATNKPIYDPYDPSQLAL